MGDRLEWLSDIGLDTEEGIHYTGSEEKYIAAVFRYFSNYEKNRTAVEEHFAQGNMADYMIKVHALKSNSRMIGAGELADEFEKLELAAMEGDRDYCIAHTTGVIREYTTLVEKLSPIGEVGEEVLADEISGEEAKKLAEEAVAALDDFDEERALSACAKLSGYPFRIRQKNMLNRAVGYIRDFLYDEAAEAIKEIIPSIE